MLKVDNLIRLSPSLICSYHFLRNTTGDLEFKLSLTQPHISAIDRATPHAQVENTRHKFQGRGSEDRGARARMILAGNTGNGDADSCGNSLLTHNPCKHHRRNRSAKYESIVLNMLNFIQSLRVPISIANNTISEASPRLDLGLLSNRRISVESNPDFSSKK
jgi:hypothetical protein